MNVDYIQGRYTDIGDVDSGAGDGVRAVESASSVMRQRRSQIITSDISNGVAIN